MAQNLRKYRDPICAKKKVSSSLFSTQSQSKNYDHFWYFFLENYLWSNINSVRSIVI